MSTTPSPTGLEGLTLAGDFHQPSRAEWEVAVAGVLNKGRPEGKQFQPDRAVARLETSTVDGLSIAPIYTVEQAVTDTGVPGAPPYTRGTTVRQGHMDAWDVRGLYEDRDAARTRSQILEDLERGVTSLWLRVDPDAISPVDLGAGLKDVLLDLAKVEVSSRTDQVAAAEALLAVFADDPKPRENLSLNLGIDPIGCAVLNGTAPDLTGMQQWVQRLSGYKNSRAFVVDATIWHNAGAGDVHEVAWALATATEYVRQLVSEGIDPNAAFDMINFRVTAGTDQFATIARLRALRTCWNRIGEVFGVAGEHRGARQHAVLSWRQLTRDDVYVNMLRGTIATFSAAVGGAEAITVLPFDSAWGLPTGFGRRIARNTQIVLAEESNIGRVNDPAGGSWYVEQLTAQIADKAWQAFQSVEAQAGMIKALAAGHMETTLAELRAAREQRLATRKQPITGVSEFPMVDEAAPDVVARPGAEPRSGVAWRRDSEVFEELRNRTNQLQESGQTPQVFLACLGARRDFGPREGFAANLFHIAGLATPSSEGGTSAEIVAAWQQAGTPVACLCSSGRVYAEQALAVATALKNAGAVTVLLAGAMKELGEDATAAAEVIDGTIAMGMDVVACLNSIVDTLGAKK